MDFAGDAWKNIDVLRGNGGGNSAVDKVPCRCNIDGVQETYPQCFRQFQNKQPVVTVCFANAEGENVIFTYRALGLGGKQIRLKAYFFLKYGSYYYFSLLPSILRQD